MEEKLYCGQADHIADRQDAIEWPGPFSEQKRG
jgi:hypothetical protein